jgi:HSP20 family protein
MVKAAKKLPVKTTRGAQKSPTVPAAWHPFNSLRHEIDHLFENFDSGLLKSPFRRASWDMEPFRRQNWAVASPAMDVAVKDNAYEIAAELPGMDENNVELKLADGMLTITGENTDTRNEKEKGYYLKERHYGSFARSLRVPEDVDIDKIDAQFQKGVLKITLPRKRGSSKPERKIKVKAA